MFDLYFLFFFSYSLVTEIDFGFIREMENQETSGLIKEVLFETKANSKPM